MSWACRKLEELCVCVWLLPPSPGWQRERGSEIS